MESAIDFFGSASFLYMKTYQGRMQICTPLKDIRSLPNNTLLIRILPRKLTFFFRDYYRKGSPLILATFRQYLLFHLPSSC